ncbi:kinetochore sim4 complex subunit FTA2 domain-containing protein [Apiospora hydei]|uniref:Kinetochore sim4 complex subunit FTA2 domain-containing protein n=1 Tax=Apiospora hydei TaxID=1337664 RepID=A0ABR1WLJ2_9PEZI
MGSLPPAPGPKLAEFKGKRTGETLHIDFIQYLGSGVHAHVWKVRIDGEIYALKMFRFVNNFTPASFFHVKLNQEEEVLHMHPFNCEARAYARLKEVNQEHVAVPCHGYILLDQEQQRILREKDTTCDWVKDWYYCGSYAGQPIQALVKDFIEFDNVGYYENGPGDNLRRITRAIDSSRTARTLLDNMAILHRVGILHKDINNSNVAQGRFLDFSTSWIKPHPCLDTRQIESARDPYNQLGITDAYAVDQIIKHWNMLQPPKLRLWFRAAQDRDYIKRLRSYGKRDKGQKDVMSEYIRKYPGRPDLYKWDPENPNAGQRNAPSRRHDRSRNKQARKIKRQDRSKA